MNHLSDAFLTRYSKCDEQLSKDDLVKFRVSKPVPVSRLHKPLKPEPIEPGSLPEALLDELRTIGSAGALLAGDTRQVDGDQSRADYRLVCSAWRAAESLAIKYDTLNTRSVEEWAVAVCSVLKGSGLNRSKLDRVDYLTGTVWKAYARLNECPDALYTINTAEFIRQNVIGTPGRGPKGSYGCSGNISKEDQLRKLLVSVEIIESDCRKLGLHFMAIDGGAGSSCRTDCGYCDICMDAKIENALSHLVVLLKVFPDLHYVDIDRSEKTPLVRASERRQEIDPSFGCLHFGAGQNVNSIRVFLPYSPYKYKQLKGLTKVDTGDSEETERNLKDFLRSTLSVRRGENNYVPRGATSNWKVPKKDKPKSPPMKKLVGRTMRLSVAVEIAALATFGIQAKVVGKGRSQKVVYTYPDGWSELDCRSMWDCINEEYGGYRRRAS